jgi:hypothetical protein
MKNRIVLQFQLWRAARRAVRSGQTDDLRKLVEENPELKERLPVGRIEPVVKGIEESRRLLQISQRPRQYAVTNGMGEIGWGTAMLCFALSSYASTILPASPWRGRVGMFFFVSVCLAMPFCLWASKRLVVQPRIGYVAFRRDKTWWLGMVVAAGISIALSFWLIPEMIHAASPSAPHAVAAAAAGHAEPSRGDRLLIAGNGLMGAILYLMFNAVSIREHRWKWLCFILILAMPPVIGHLHPGNFFEMSPPATLFQGSVYLLSGAITLVWFLRLHHLIAPAAE